MARAVEHTPWLKIKKDYFLGMTPRALAVKYKLTAKQIGEKACKDGWVQKKANISNKLDETFHEEISDLTGLSLRVLKDVLEASEDNKDRIAAARAVLDISGLKKHEIKNTGGSFTLFFQKVEEKAAHIEMREMPIIEMKADF